MLHQAPDQVLSQVHVVFQVGKRHLRLDHPELGGVPRRVGILRPERRTEGIDVTQSAGEQLGFQLTGYGKAGLLAEKIFRRVRPLGFTSRRREGQGGDAKHLAGALAVGAGYDGGVQKMKTALAEELVHREGRFGANAEQGAVLVGARPQMGNGAQKLVGVAFLL